MKRNAENIKQAKFSIKPDKYLKSTTSSGKSYEHGVYIRMKKRYGDQYSFMKNPWILWQSSVGKWHGCEPDLLMFDHERKKLWIIEIKSWNWGQSYTDIRYLYSHVLKCLYPEYEIRGLGANPKKGILLKNLDLEWDIEAETQIKLVRIPDMKK